MSKKQSNFYKLERAVQKYKIPFTAQIIPTLQFPDFQSDEKHVLTFVGGVLKHKIRLIGNNALETSMKLTDQDVHYLTLDNEKNYKIISEIFEYQKRDNLIWLAVLQQCQYKTHTFNVGDILEILTESKYKSLMRKGKRKLKIKVHPHEEIISLPQNLCIELVKCESYHSFQKRTSLSNVVFDQNLPCLIRFPTDGQYFDTNNVDLSGITCVLCERYTSHVLVGCKKNRNNEDEIHSFPTKLPLEVEVLHGEIPVAQFSETEIHALCHQMIYENPCKAEEIHQKRFLKNMNLKMFEYQDIDSDDDDDEYTNTEEFSYVRVDSLVEKSEPSYQDDDGYEIHNADFIDTSTNDKIENNNKIVVGSEKSLYEPIKPTRGIHRKGTYGRVTIKDNYRTNTVTSNNKNNCNLVGDYICMDENIKASASLKNNELPTYISENKKPLNSHFLLSSDPIDEKTKSAYCNNDNGFIEYDKSEVYTKLDITFEPAGYHQLDETMRSKLNGVSTCDENPVDFQDCDGYEVNYFTCTPPVPVPRPKSSIKIPTVSLKTTITEKPIPSPRPNKCNLEDCFSPQTNRLSRLSTHSYLEFLPDGEVNESGVEIFI